MNLPVKLATDAALEWSGSTFRVKVDGTTIDRGGAGSSLRALGAPAGSITHASLSSGLAATVELFDRGDGSDGSISQGSGFTTQIQLATNCTITALGVSFPARWGVLKCTGTLTVNAGCSLDMDALGGDGGAGGAGGAPNNAGSSGAVGTGGDIVTNSVVTAGTAGTGGTVPSGNGANGGAGTVGGTMQAGSGGGGGGGGASATQAGFSSGASNSPATTRKVIAAPQLVFNPTSLPAANTVLGGHGARGGAGGGGGRSDVGTGGTGGTGRAGNESGGCLHVSADTITLTGTAVITANANAGLNANAASNGTAGGVGAGGGGGAGGVGGSSGGAVIIRARVFGGTATSNGGTGGTGGTGGAGGVGGGAGGNGATGGNGGPGLVSIAVLI